MNGLMSCLLAKQANPGSVKIEITGDSSLIFSDYQPLNY